MPDADLACVRMNQEITAASGGAEILSIYDARVQEFNIVSFITAFHRLAKHAPAAEARALVRPLVANVFGLVK